jgi:aminoglycoside phosphotransferase (APT) family kinase protein
VVRPFGYYPGHLAIATVEIPGETLREHLSRYARRLPSLLRNRRRLSAHARLCGLWLRRFHDVTSRGAASFDADDLADYCRVRLALVDAKTRMPLGERVSARILARIREVASSAPAADNQVAGRHNDFASHNIVVDDRPGISVLDFSMFDHGSTYYDVCNFWLELEMLKSDPTYSPRTLSGLQRDFLDAYGSIAPTHPLFALVRCRYTLNRLLTTLNQSATGTLSAAYRRRIAAACHRWLMDFAADRPAAQVR